MYRINFQYGLVLALLALSLWLLPFTVRADDAAAAAEAEETELQWLATAFSARGTINNIEEIFSGDIDLEDSYFAGLAIGKEVYKWRDKLTIETEAQIVQHFERQDHTEFTVALMARWIDFPWNDYLRTSFAVGNGLSYATNVPEIEVEKNDESVRLLDFLVLELDFALPDYPDYALVTRLHHRSGAYGLFDGIEGGSNFLTAGFRFRF